MGGGVVGMNAARMAAGLGAEVVIVERSIPRMRELDNMFQGRILTRYSTQDAVEEEVLKADVVIGAVLTAAGLDAAQLMQASQDADVKAKLLQNRQGVMALLDVRFNYDAC